jgi:hypothetical protein
MNLINSFHCQTTELVNLIDGVQPRHFAIVIDSVVQFLALCLVLVIVLLDGGAGVICCCFVLYQN